MTQIEDLKSKGQDFADSIGDLSAKYLQGKEVTRDLLLAESLLKIMQEVHSAVEKLRKLSPISTDFEAEISNKKNLGYPKFLIDSNGIHKIGLKKDKITEYRHTASVEEFKKIIEELKKEGSNELDVKSFTGKLEKLGMPSYKVYLVLNALNETREISNPKKSSYIPKEGENFSYLNFQSVFEKLKKL